MAKQIYLLGGGDQVDYYDLDKKIAENSKNKKIFAINLTTEDRNKLEQKKQELSNHFKRVGYKDIKFASDSKNIILDMQEADVLFIAGGDTELLLSNIKKNKLARHIKSFNKVIEGNSAGAYTCCNKYIQIKEKIREISGLGLVNIKMKAHYTPEFDNKLLELSESNEIYAVAEKSAIIVDSGGHFNYLGDIFLFSEKQKKKLN